MGEIGVLSSAICADNAERFPWPEIEVVVASDRLAELAEVISKQPAVGVDLEGNGRHRYPERVCLFQMSIPGAIYIVDTLTVDDMSPLGELLCDPTIVKIAHSADYDLRCLDRDWGFRVRNLFDSAIAAAFLGLQKTGLAPVLQEVLGVEISKSRRLQKSDWTNRPLGAEALGYAASDVAYLHDLRGAMQKRLDDLGRSSWVAEECERQTRVRYEAPDPATAFLNIKGSRVLDARGLAVLKELAALRERHARQRGRPHFRVLANSTLVALAEEPDADLSVVTGLGPFARKPLVSELRRALETGLKAPPYDRPATARRPRMQTAEKQRLEELKLWRKAHGDSLSIDPSLVWPTISLERLARDPGAGERETMSPDVRGWQSAEFGNSLLEAAKRLHLRSQ